MNKPTHGSAWPLRFGIMVPGPKIAWWQAEVIRRVIVAGVAVPVLAIVDSSPPQAHRSGRLRRESAWNLYNRLCVCGKIAAAKSTTWADIVPSVETVEVAVERRGKFSEYFTPADVDRVRSHDLDFVLRFGFNIIRGDILTAARHGVWSYHHGDIFRVRGQPACFWEVFRDDAVIGITLQRLTDSLDAGIVLGMRHIATTRKSYVRTRDTALRAGVGMVEQACRAILAGDHAAVLGTPAKTIAPIDRAPGAVTVSSFACRLAWRRVAEALGWLLIHDQWNVGIVKASMTDILAGTLAEPRWLPHPKRGEFIADPFAVRVENETIIVVEHLIERTNVGRIRTIRLDVAGTILTSDEPFSEAVHLSYPYLVQDGERYLCVPEMSEAGEVVLFEADLALRSWRRLGPILRGVRLIDPTLFKHNDCWWLFGAVRTDGCTDELHAWHSLSPIGPWAEHTGNPLKIDARSTRPAGTVVMHEGALYRPSQDCSRSYGGAVSVNRIDKLTPTSFSETPVARIACGQSWAYRRGLHTLSRIDNDTFVIDAKRARFSLHGLLRQLQRQRIVPAHRSSAAGIVAGSRSVGEP